MYTGTVITINQRRAYKQVTVRKLFSDFTNKNVIEKATWRRSSFIK